MWASNKSYIRPRSAPLIDLQQIYNRFTGDKSCHMITVTIPASTASRTDQCSVAELTNMVLWTKYSASLSNGLVRQSLSRPRAGMTYFQKNKDKYELITSASECLTSSSRVPHECSTVRQLGANFKHVWNLPELMQNSASCPRVTPEFHELLPNFQPGSNSGPVWPPHKVGIVMRHKFI